MTDIFTDCLTWVVGGQTLAMNDQLNLGPVVGDPTQVFTLVQGTAIQYLTVASQPGMALSWQDMTWGTIWDDTSSAQSTWYQAATATEPAAFFSGWSGATQMWQPNAAGNAVVMGPLPTGMSLTTPPAYTPPSTGNTLGTIPIAMYAPQNPNVQNPAAPDWGASGSWEYWGETLLGRPGPIIAMPQAVGINPNYGGDIDVWQGGDLSINTDTTIQWMISVGLSYPGGPTLTAAAAAGVALNDASAPMDADWANAALSARFGSDTAGIIQNGVWSQANEVQHHSIIYLRPGWEMTGDWYTAWGRNNADFDTAFGPAFVRCVEIFRSMYSQPDKNGNTCQVIAVFNPNYDYATVGINLDSIYPGDAYVDMIALDLYDQPQYQGGLEADGVTPVLSGAARFAQYCLPPLQAADAYAKTHSKQVGICEFGAGAAGDNPDFINGVANWASQAQSVVGVLGYWGGNADSGYNSDLDSFPNEKAAFIADFHA
jgi:hypothetical protein